MKNKVLAVLSMTVGLLLVSGPMFAHHSVSLHDLTRFVTITGNVTKFEFINPHILIRVDVKDAKGNVEKWVGQSGHPNRAIKETGWNKNTFQPGEQITITGNPYKDGRRIMGVVRIVRSNGEEVRVEESARLKEYLEKTGKSRKEVLQQTGETGK